MSAMKAVLGDMTYEEYLAQEMLNRQRAVVNKLVGWREVLVELEADVREAETNMKQYIEEFERNVLRLNR